MNKKRFFLGLGMFGIEAFAIVSLFLSELSKETITYIGIISAFVIYNILAFIFLYKGSEE